jgi:2-polyprenyl-3-methyl-5-hydroxy-6-metoxy-1,4-benzoquinol methylase
MIRIACLLALSFVTVVLNGQAVTTANEPLQTQSFEEMVKALERPDRASWQKPEEVIAAMGTLKGLKVMDIGCGTGYFSFRLQQAGAFVIAADVDDRFLAYVDSVRTARGIAEKYLQTRKLQPNDPGLEKKEIDVAFIVNTYHHIEDRKAYFTKLKKGMKSTGYLVIIDFFKKDMPMGPPTSMKLSAEEIIRELSQAGFTKYKTDDKLLPFQYLLFAL